MTNIVHNIVPHDPNDTNNDPLMVHIEHYSYTNISVDNQVDHKILKNSRNKSTKSDKNSASLPSGHAAVDICFLCCSTKHFRSPLHDKELHSPSKEINISRLKH